MPKASEPTRETPLVLSGPARRAYHLEDALPPHRDLVDRRDRQQPLLDRPLRRDRRLRRVRQWPITARSGAGSTRRSASNAAGSSTAGRAEGSATPPGWYGWLHHQTDIPPTESDYVPRAWEKPYLPNMTGTPAAYRPQGSLLKDGTRPRTGGDYDAWDAGLAGGRSELSAGVTRDAGSLLSPQVRATRRQRRIVPPPTKMDSALAVSRTITLGALALSCLLGAAPARADRIRNNTAVFSGLDKITGRIISFKATLGETVQFGSLQVTARACYTRPAKEAPQTDTFVEIDELSASQQPKRIFSGWMFAASPGLHGLEHPIYDIWLTNCEQPGDTVVDPAQSADAGSPGAAARADRRRPAAGDRGSLAASGRGGAEAAPQACGPTGTASGFRGRRGATPGAAAALLPRDPISDRPASRRPGGPARAQCPTVA